MPMTLKMLARDVILLRETAPKLVSPEDVPEHTFEITRSASLDFKLEFDGSKVQVPERDINDLFDKICTTTRRDWEYSSDETIKTTFKPLERVIRKIDTTPAYQLFLAGFHIASEIGMLSSKGVFPDDASLRFQFLNGNLPWTRGKKGRLFIFPFHVIDDNTVRLQLIANGKLFESHLYIGNESNTRHIEGKLIVPYVTPPGFFTSIDDKSRNQWKHLCQFITNLGGGHVQ